MACFRRNVGELALRIPPGVAYSGRADSASRHAAQGKASIVSDKEEGKGLAVRISLASAIFVLAACASHADAQQLIVANGPIATQQQGSFLVRDGTFSDSMSSGGQNYYSQALAQGFSISSSATLGSLSFWGASEYLNSNQPWLETGLSSNIDGFQVALYRVNEDGTMPQLTSWNINRGFFSQQATGTYTINTFSPIFKVSCQLSGSTVLDAGKYAITIGGRLLQPDGDAFAWIDGEWDGSGGATQSYITIGDIPSQWGTWLPLTDGTSGAFELYSAAVPAPSALALLALASGARSRRRRH